MGNAQKDHPDFPDRSGGFAIHDSRFTFHEGDRCVSAFIGDCS